MSPVVDSTAVVGARYATAGSFLEALAAGDFAGIGATLADGAVLQTLEPTGSGLWTGRDEIRSAFIQWFGATDDFELVEAVVGDAGFRLYLRWRVRMRAARLGPGWFGIEQHGYVDTDDQGEISQLWLLSSGHWSTSDAVADPISVRMEGEL